MSLRPECSETVVLAKTDMSDRCLYTYMCIYVRDAEARQYQATDHAHACLERQNPNAPSLHIQRDK
jgi:hypothetical protein